MYQRREMAVHPDHSTRAYKRHISHARTVCWQHIIRQSRALAANKYLDIIVPPEIYFYHLSHPTNPNLPKILFAQDQLACPATQR